MRTRYDETPQWEFCEGFMAAVLCSRRVVEADEYLAALLGVPGAGAVADAEDGSFASDAQRSRFMCSGTSAGSRSPPPSIRKSTRSKTIVATTPK